MAGKKGMHTKSWKADALYWKRRYEELLSSNKSHSTPSEDTEIKTAKPKTLTASTSKEIANIKGAHTPLIEKKPLLEQGQREDLGASQPHLSVPVNSPKETKGGEIMEKEEKDLEVAQENQNSADDYKYQCPDCSALFNDLNDGKCPKCGVELE